MLFASVGTGASPVQPSKARRALLLRRHRQPENRNLPRPRDIQPSRLFRIRQIKCLAMFAAIDFGIASPSLLHIPASLLEHIGCVEPAFEMPAAELAFLILFVASPLPRLLDFDLVPGELRRSLCPRGYGSASGQRIYPRRCGPCAARFSYELFNSTRSLLRDARFAVRPFRAPKIQSVARRAILQNRGIVTGSGRAAFPAAPP